MIRSYEIGVLFIPKYLVKTMASVIKIQITFNMHQLGNLNFQLNIMIEENEKYHIGYPLQDDDN